MQAPAVIAPNTIFCQSRKQLYWKFLEFVGPAGDKVRIKLGRGEQIIDRKAFDALLAESHEVRI